MAVHESLHLHVTTDKFYIQPVDSGIDELLVIDRVSQEIGLQANKGQLPSASVTKPIYGIFGIIRLIAGPYLIVITKREKIGDVDGHTVWKVIDTEVLSFKRTLLHLTEQQNAHNKTYLNMLESALKMDGYYYCTNFDLTHSFQRLFNTSPDFHTMSLVERADPRFMWNGHLLRELSQQSDLGRYCLPVVHGFIECQSCNINNKTFDYVLISRRSVYRAGTRFYVRGIDTEGQVANFVETEQIVQYEGSKCSYVQVRGSIPLFWTQRPNLQYKPKFKLNTSSHIEVFQRHFDDLVFNYGEQILINLVNHTGGEGQLEKAFSQSVTNTKNPKIRYEYFDFHHECRKMRWDRLSILTDRLGEDIKRIGYFAIGKDGICQSQQEGVFRTNCIDCLDRTNVVQGILARIVLEKQLTKLGVLEASQRITDMKTFISKFNNIWADNADAVSKQYAGTGALKTDFTRQGKRTKMGLVMDGWNSLIRYFKNNFGDGFRQDAIDLILGNYVIEENEGISRPSPLQAERDWKFYAVPVIFVIAMGMCLISILLPDESWSEQFMYILFWGTASIVSLGVIYIYGSEFVDQPKLVHTQARVNGAVMYDTPKQA
ncbi:phosphatidylinositol-3-phosphatase SAC1-like isoform X1 [Ostrea edulis]|uniref:phosphatidylinositol-3-phosphatase SAC1-like isoform X1 n=2 Tax=Ostrea edulis TaxID=37623 RepID=UPI0024AFE28D|nr:phosphatidylinositol-3-phosphatase SAC1-like isoform X1 [Ostrea edulis]